MSRMLLQLRPTSSTTSTTSSTRKKVNEDLILEDEDQLKDENQPKDSDIDFDFEFDYRFCVLRPNFDDSDDTDEFDDLIRVRLSSIRTDSIRFAPR